MQITSQDSKHNFEQLSQNSQTTLSILNIPRSSNIKDSILKNTMRTSRSSEVYNIFTNEVYNTKKFIVS